MHDQFSMASVYVGENAAIPNVFPDSKISTRTFVCDEISVQLQLMTRLLRYVISWHKLTFELHYF